MKHEYTDVVQELSYKLFQAFWEREPDLEQKVHQLDGIVNKLLRRIGFLVVSLVLLELSSEVTRKARENELTIHRCKRVKYL